MLLPCEITLMIGIGLRKERSVFVKLLLIQVYWGTDGTGDETIRERYDIKGEQIKGNSHPRPLTSEQFMAGSNGTSIICIHDSLVFCLWSGCCRRTILIHLFKAFHLQVLSLTRFNGPKKRKRARCRIIISFASFYGVFSHVCILEIFLLGSSSLGHTKGNRILIAVTWESFQSLLG